MSSLSWRSSSLHFFTSSTVLLQFYLIVTWLPLASTGMPTYGYHLGPLRCPLVSLAGAHIALTSSLEALADSYCLLPFHLAARRFLQLFYTALTVLRLLGLDSFISTMVVLTCLTLLVFSSLALVLALIELLRVHIRYTLSCILSLHSFAWARLVLSRQNHVTRLSWLFLCTSRRANVLTGSLPIHQRIWILHIFENFNSTLLQSRPWSSCSLLRRCAPCHSLAPLRFLFVIDCFV